MKYFNDGFYGREPYSVTNSAGGDFYSRFLENCKTQPVDWYYRDKKISYDYNKQGHRCKDIADIDLNNYVLFTGCSHTEGIGLELETVYPHAVAKDLNMDYYNLGLAATGDDISAYNLFIFMQTVLVKPKYLIIQWSDLTRTARYDKKEKLIIPTLISQEIDNTVPFFVYGDSSGFFRARRFFIEQMYKRLFSDVPIIYISFTQHYEYEFYPRDFYPIDDLHLDELDFARDLSHYGVKSHRHLADKILNTINKYNNETTNNTNGGEV